MDNVFTLELQSGNSERTAKLFSDALKRLKRELVGLDPDLRDAGRSSQKMATDFQQTSAKVTTSTKRMKTDTVQMSAEMKRALASIGTAFRGVGQGAGNFAKAGSMVEKSAKSQRAGMQQLGYQISDVGASFGSGINPMVIFAQQGGQVAQAMSLMGGAAGKFGALLAGPWGAAILSGVTILGLLLTKKEKNTKASNDLTEAEKRLKDAEQELQGILNNQLTTYDARLRLAALAIKARREETIATRQNTLAELENLRVRGQSAATSIGSGPGGKAELDSMVAQNQKNQDNIQKKVDELTASIDKDAKLVGAGLAYLTERRAERISSPQGRIEYDAERDIGRAKAEYVSNQSAENRRKLETEILAITKKKEAALRAISDTEAETAAGQRISEKASRDAEKAREKAAKELSTLQQKLTEEYSTQTAEQKRHAAAMEDIQQLAKTNPYDAWLFSIQEVVRNAENLKKEMQAVREKYSPTAAINGRSDRAIEEIKSAGFEKGEEDRLVRQVERDREDALDKSAKSFGDEIRDSIGDGSDELEKRIRQTEMWSSAGDILGGKIGRAMSDGAEFMRDVMEGDYSRIGGKIGGLLKLGETIFNKTNAKGETTNLFKDAFAGQIEKTGLGGLINGKSGSLLKDIGAQGSLGGKLGAGLGGAYGGFQTGAQVYGLFKSLGIKSSKTGAQIGGAAGSFLPIPGGDIIGSAVGEIIGGLFKKNRTARSLVTSVDSASVAGKDTKQYGEAQSLGEALQEGLRNIAERLDADLSNFSVSIGTRGDEIRVNGSGSSLKLKSGAKGFGDDAEAALRFAISDAIKDGALGGLSDFAKKAINNLDVEAALSVIERFKAVTESLDESADPFTQSLKEISENFAQLRKDMVAAGASAEDLGKASLGYEKQVGLFVEDYLSPIRDYQKSFFGEGSGLTVFDRYRNSQTDYAQYSDKIARGESVDFDKFTSSGRENLDLAREVYGQSGAQYQDIRARQIEDARMVEANIKAQAEKLEMEQKARDEAVIAEARLTNDHLAQIGYDIGRLVKGGGGFNNRFNINSF